MDVSLDSLIGVPSSYGYLNDLAANPTVLITIVVIVIAYLALFATLGGGAPAAAAVEGAGAASSGLSMLEVLLWAVFVLLVLLNGMSYMFNMNVTASLSNLFSRMPEIDVIVKQEETARAFIPVPSPVPEIKTEKQVFHIPGNLYGYEDSKAICKAYGARLASYGEIDDAYKNGGDWCSFGWSEGQMAFYPTQIAKYDALQSIPGHEHDCGRPGINGGYIGNPNVRFGINCYGNKPEITKQEAVDMAESPLYPPTQSELDFEKKVRRWREKLPSLAVAPFNHDNWSMP
jgi:hypothetical protein